ncbi:hypothetical protein JTE90_011530 [Oedothorax gibbosus]|uniref:Uncharacterized protein n=1 Tax=Oedothorax gibbosus TaxID=931172 RepID=A0AAV6UIE8_9ARAC|nr:hypothetical protein JTE90_011530 [Oedothorax gibbosus]
MVDQQQARGPARYIWVWGQIRDTPEIMDSVGCDTVRFPWSIAVWPHPFNASSSRKIHPGKRHHQRNVQNCDALSFHKY